MTLRLMRLGNTARLWLPLLFCLLASTVRAHDPSKSYLNLVFGSNQITGQWDIPLADLKTVVRLDLDQDGFVTWDELNTCYTNVTKYVFAHLKITLDGHPTLLRVQNHEPAVEDFTDGTYVQIPFTLESPATNGHATGEASSFASAKNVELEYNLFFDVNPLHRGLLKLEANGKTQSTIFTPAHRTQQFATATSSPAQQFLSFLQEGIWHIWTGYDHILFLLALLLPAVLRRDAGQWRGVSALRPAFFNVLKIVTAFTVAHSLTLSLAALQIVRLPSRLTESAIALSVILAAANNLRPMIRERSWLVAFGFGLIHGFGFANALSDLGLGQGVLALTLAGFNLGVETGQLAIVSVFLPIAFRLRNSSFYRKFLLRAGSATIIAIAAIWLLERVFDFKLLPF